MFNTHQAVKKFIGVGIKEEQAELIIDTIASMKQYDISHLATNEKLNITRIELKGEISDVKEEMAEFKSEIRQEISEFKSEIRQDISELKTVVANSKNETLKWMFGMMIPVIMGIISILVKIH